MTICKPACNIRTLTKLLKAWRGVASRRRAGISARAIMALMATFFFRRQISVNNGGAKTNRLYGGVMAWRLFKHMNISVVAQHNARGVAENMANNWRSVSLAWRCFSHNERTCGHFSRWRQARNNNNGGVAYMVCYYARYKLMYGHVNMWHVARQHMPVNMA